MENLVKKVTKKPQSLLPKNLIKWIQNQFILNQTNSKFFLFHLPLFCFFYDSSLFSQIIILLINYLKTYILYTPSPFFTPLYFIHLIISQIFMLYLILPSPSFSSSYINIFCTSKRIIYSNWFENTRKRCQNVEK